MSHDQYLSAEEHNVVVWLNFARGNPHGFAAELEARLPHYNGKYLSLPGKQQVTTVEGVHAVKECIAKLKKLQPMQELHPVSAMCLPARDHVKTQGPTGGVGHDGPDGSTPFQRMQRYGRYDQAAENIDYGNFTGSEIVMALVVDDGVRDRGHFKNIFNPAFNQVGIATGPHDYYINMCVHTYATGWQSRPEFDDAAKIGVSVLQLVAIEGPSHTVGAGDYLAAKVQAIIRAQIAKKFVAKLKKQRELRKEGEAMQAEMDGKSAANKASLSSRAKMHKTAAPLGCLHAALFKSDGLKVRLFTASGLVSPTGGPLRTHCEIHSVVGNTGKVRGVLLDKKHAVSSDGSEPQYHNSVGTSGDATVQNRLHIRIRVLNEHANNAVLGVCDIPMNDIAERPDLDLKESTPQELEDAALWYALEKEEVVAARDSPEGQGMSESEKATLYAMCLSSDTKTDYSDCHKKKGKDIVKYTKKRDDGVVYLYQNHTTDMVLDEQTKYKFDNMCVDGEREDLSDLKLLIGPGEERLVIVRIVDTALSFGMKVSNSYDVIPYRADKFNKQTAKNGLTQPNKMMVQGAAPLSSRGSVAGRGGSVAGGGGGGGGNASPTTPLNPSNSTPGGSGGDGGDEENQLNGGNKNKQNKEVPKNPDGSDQTWLQQNWKKVVFWVIIAIILTILLNVLVL